MLVKQESVSQSAINVSPWFLLQAPQVLALTPFNDALQPGSKSQINSFLPVLVTVLC